MKFKRVLSALLAFSVVMTSWLDINSFAESGTEIMDSGMPDESTTVSEEIVDYHVSINVDGTVFWTGVEDAVIYKIKCVNAARSYEFYADGENSLSLSNNMQTIGGTPDDYTVEVYAEKSDGTLLLLGSSSYSFCESLNMVFGENDKVSMNWTAIEGSIGYKAVVSAGEVSNTIEFSTNCCDDVKKVLFEDFGIRPDDIYYAIDIYSVDQEGAERHIATTNYAFRYSINTDESHCELRWKEVAGVDHYTVKLIDYYDESREVFSYDCYTNRTIKHTQYFSDEQCPETCRVNIYWVDEDGTSGLIGWEVYDSIIQDFCKVWDPQFSYNETTGVLTWADNDTDYETDSDYNLQYNISFNDKLAVPLATKYDETAQGGSFTNLTLPIYLAEYNSRNEEKLTGDIVVSIESAHDGYYASDYYIYSYDGCDVVTSLAAPSNLKVENNAIKYDAVDGAIGYLVELSGEDYFSVLACESNYDMDLYYNALGDSAPVGTYQVRVCSLDVNGDRSEYSDYVAFEYNQESGGSDEPEQENNTWTPNFVFDETTGRLSWDNCDEILSGSNSYSVYAGANSIGTTWGNSTVLPLVLATAHLDGKQVTGDLEIRIIGDDDYDGVPEFEADATYAYNYDGCDINGNLAKITNIYLDEYDGWASARTEQIENAIGYIFEFKNGDIVTRLYSFPGTGGGSGYIGYSYFWAMLDIPYGGEYQVRACAVDINGDRSEFSDYFNFAYTPETENNTWTPNFVFDETTGILTWDNYEGASETSKDYTVYASDAAISDAWGWTPDGGNTFERPKVSLPVMLALRNVEDNEVTGDLVITIRGKNGTLIADSGYAYSYDGCDINENLVPNSNITNQFIDKYNNNYSISEIEGAIGYIFEIRTESAKELHSSLSPTLSTYSDALFELLGIVDGGEYQVRACAVDINGDRSEFSDYVTFSYIPTPEDDDADPGTGGESSDDAKYKASGEFTFAFNDYGLNTTFDEVDIAQYNIKETDIVTVTASYSGEKDISDLMMAVSARTADWQGYTGVSCQGTGNSYTITTTVKDIIQWNIMEGKFNSFADASHLVFTFWNTDDTDEGITVTYDISITSPAWTPNFVYNESTGELSWDNYVSDSDSNNKTYILYAGDSELGMAWAWSFDNGSSFTTPSLSLPVAFALNSLEGNDLSGDINIALSGNYGEYVASETFPYSYDGCDINTELDKISEITIDAHVDHANYDVSDVENAVGYIFEFRNGDKLVRYTTTTRMYIGYTYFLESLGIENGGDYEVRACAVDINGDRSEFSDYFTFTYTPDGTQINFKSRFSGQGNIIENTDGTVGADFLTLRHEENTTFTTDDVIQVTVKYDGELDTSDWTVVAMAFDKNWYGWNAKFGVSGTLTLSTTIERLMAINSITDLNNLNGISFGIWHVDPAFIGETFAYDVRIFDKDSFINPEPTRIEIPEGYSFYETGSLTVLADEESGVYAKFPLVEATEYAFDENDEITVSFDYAGELDVSALKAAVFGIDEDQSGWNGLCSEPGTSSLTVTVKELMEANSISEVPDLYGFCGDIWDLTTDFIGETFTYTIAIKPAEVASRDITKAILNDGVLMENIDGNDIISVVFRPHPITECGHVHSEEELAVNEYCTWAGICFAGAVSGGVMGYDAWLQPDNTLFSANFDGIGGEEFEFTISLDYYRQCMENDRFFEDNGIIEKMTLSFWNGDVVSVTAKKDTREVLAFTSDNSPVAVARIDNEWFDNGSIQGDYHLNSDEIVREVTTFGELRNAYKEIVYDGFNFESDTVGGTADDYIYCLYIQTQDLSWVCSDRIALDEEIHWDINSIALNDSSVITDYGVQFVQNYSKGLSETVDALEFGDVFIINPAEAANPVTSIELDCEEITLRVGDQLGLLATVLPEDATDSDIVWTTGDYRIASVNLEGMVYASAVGTTKIAATAENKTAYCVVTVVEAPDIEAPLVSVDIDNDSIFLAWEEVDGATEYKVYRSFSDGGEKELLATTDSFVYTDIVEEDGEYYYYVTAVDSEGTESLYSSVVFADIKISARVPSNITLTPGNGSVTVKWDAESRAEKYRLALYADGKCTIVSDNITSTEYTVKNLQPGYEYGILILSYSNGKWSAFEDEDISYGVPTGSFIPVVSAPAVSDGNVTISWSKVSGATSYRVYRANTKTGTKTRIGIVTQTSFVDTTASEGKTYYYFIQAYNTNTASSGSYSGSVSATVPYSAPPTPAISSVTATTTSVTVAWNKVSGATSYRLYRADSPTGSKTLIKPVTTASYTDTSVTAGKTYYYFLTAYSSVSGLSSTYSAEKAVTVPKPVTPLAKPVVTVVSGGGNATVTWDEIPDATSYCVFRSTSLTGTRTLVKVRTSTYLIDNTVKAGSTYYYFVLAYNATNGAKSAYSAGKSIKIVNTFNVLPEIKTGATNDKSATISWNVVPGATSYRIYRLYNGRRTLLASQSMTEYTDNTVINGATYIYQIKAYSATTSALTDYSNKKTLKIMPAPEITSGNVLGKITWSNVSGATSYRIYRAASSNGEKTLIKAVTTTTYTDTTAVNGNRYYYFVAAYDNKTGTLTDCSNYKLIQIKK